MQRVYNSLKVVSCPSRCNTRFSSIRRHIASFVAAGAIKEIKYLLAQHKSLPNYLIRGYSRLSPRLSPSNRLKNTDFMLKHFVPSDYVQIETFGVFRFFSASKITLEMHLRFILTMNAYIFSSF